MRLFFVPLQGARVERDMPAPGAPDVTFEVACPACQASQLVLRGDGAKPAGRDAYVARAIALCCKASVGTLRVEVDTLFGIEEDEAVLQGRARVY